MNADAIIIAVAHKEFENMAVSDLNQLYGGRDKVLLDIKGILDKRECEKTAIDIGDCNGVSGIKIPPR